MTARKVVDRNTLLSHFRQYAPPEEMQGLPITSAVQLKPVLTTEHVFRHNLGTDPNSRSLPAWASESNTREPGAAKPKRMAKPPPIDYSAYNTEEAKSKPAPATKPVEAP
jgi:hypothetical protein